jgi:ribosomal protein S18 acetylase RimI-like enzyme
METSVLTLARSNWKCVESLAVPAGPEEARLLSTVTDISFGAISTDIQLEMTAKSISEGRMLASLAWCDGVPVSAGFAVGDGYIREIAGISTLPDYRRRGFAGAVITNLLNRFFADGGTIAWLTPGDEGAQLLYASLGFMVAGTQVNATLGAGRSA